MWTFKSLQPGQPELLEVSRTPRVSGSSSNQFKFPQRPTEVREKAFKGWDDRGPTERPRKSEETDGKLSFLRLFERLPRTPQEPGVDLWKLHRRSP
ncbi:hypothetical protein ILYODFUR_034456 [Ilyodon furcidens]|uniref:Uncharacterized protein n=1 Tax=Ilyodon furcidens TaxID=33524 RepID=A0ABV0UAS1_9TELE